LAHLLSQVRSQSRPAARLTVVPVHQHVGLQPGSVHVLRRFGLFQSFHRQESGGLVEVTFGEGAQYQRRSTESAVCSPLTQPPFANSCYVAGRGTSGTIGYSVTY
ncbi:MAG: hypothetical protein KF784_19710, partial [Fimbriimonadaceae bacterium]|nr:hypothetical protein [Fimbriimonadaceae bacterium]